MATANLSSNDRPNRSLSIDRKVIRYALIFLLVMTTPVFVHQMRLNSRISRIARLGGEVSTGPPPVYWKFAHRRPKFVSTAFRSRFGLWLFSQFSVIYSVDLRALKNEDNVNEALLVARDCAHLVEVTLYQSGVKDSHLEVFRTGFPKLQRLKLNETRVTDAGIEHLRRLRRLELLNLQRTDVSNESVPALASLPRLKVLHIAETRIDNVQAIRDARPGCFINCGMVTLKQTIEFHRRNARRAK